MSLEELLRDDEHSPEWKRHRRKIFLVIAGIGSLAIVVLALTYLLTHHTRSVPIATETSKPNEKNISDVLRLKDEAEQMQEKLKALRSPASNTKPKAFEDREGSLPKQTEILDYDPGDGFSEIAKDREDLYIPTGAVFQAQLLTPIKTSLERTLVMAEITNEFRMDMKRRLLKGTRLIGRARLNPILKGVIVEFETIVSPEGIESPVNGLALSRNALPEIEGLFFSDKLVNYGTALAFGFLSGFADAARTTNLTLVGSVPNVSVNNSVATGFSTAAFQIADEALQDIRNHSVEYVVVPAGERIFVALTHRYDIPKGGKHAERF